jgi:hypothetical protein
MEFVFFEMEIGYFIAPLRKFLVAMTHIVAHTVNIPINPERFVDNISVESTNRAQ